MNRAVAGGEGSAIQNPGCCPGEDWVRPCAEGGRLKYRFEVKHHQCENKSVAGGVLLHMQLEDFDGVYTTWGLDRNGMLASYNYSLI